MLITPISKQLFFCNDQSDCDLAEIDSSFKQSALWNHASNEIKTYLGGNLMGNPHHRAALGFEPPSVLIPMDVSIIIWFIDEYAEILANDNTIVKFVAGANEKSKRFSNLLESDFINPAHYKPLLFKKFSALRNHYTSGSIVLKTEHLELIGIDITDALTLDYTNNNTKALIKSKLSQFLKSCAEHLLYIKQSDTLQNIVHQIDDAMSNGIMIKQPSLSQLCIIISAMFDFSMKQFLLKFALAIAHLNSNPSARDLVRHIFAVRNGAKYGTGTPQKQYINALLKVSLGTHFFDPHYGQFKNVFKAPYIDRTNHLFQSIEWLHLTKTMGIDPTNQIRSEWVIEYQIIRDQIAHGRYKDNLKSKMLLNALNRWETLKIAFEGMLSLTTKEAMKMQNIDSEMYPNIDDRLMVLMRPKING